MGVRPRKLKELLGYLSVEPSLYATSVEKKELVALIMKHRGNVVVSGTL